MVDLLIAILIKTWFRQIDSTIWSPYDLPGYFLTGESPATIAIVMIVTRRKSLFQINFPEADRARSSETSNLLLFVIISRTSRGFPQTLKNLDTMKRNHPSISGGENEESGKKTKMPDITDNDENRSTTSSSGNTANNPTVEEIWGNARKLFQEGKYDSAFEQCTRLIELAPNDAIHYGNRAGCTMKLRKFAEALKDAKKSVEVNPEFIQGHCWVILSAMKLHKLGDMNNSVAQLKLIDPGNEVLQMQALQMKELDSHLENLQNAEAARTSDKDLEYIEKCLEICPSFLVYKVKKLSCLVNLRRFSEAKALANEILKENPDNADCHYFLGECLYDTNIEKAVEHFEKAFTLNPEIALSRKRYTMGKGFLEKTTEADNAYKSQCFAQAHNLYMAMSMDFTGNKTMQIILFSNMAQASYKLGNLDRCLRECERVLQLKPDHQEALIHRAQCYLDQREYGKAIEVLKRASSIDPSIELLLEEAQWLFAVSEKNYYAILGVEEGAPMEAITKAYKALAKKFHPDRHMNATEERRKFNEMKFKEMTNAYQLLEERSHNRNRQQHNSSMHPPIAIDIPTVLTTLGGGLLFWLFAKVFSAMTSDNNSISTSNNNRNGQQSSKNSDE